MKRTLYGLSFKDEDAAREAEERRKNGTGNGEEEDDLGVGDEEETEELLSLDPKEWKVISIFFSLDFDFRRQCEVDDYKPFYRNKTTMPFLVFLIFDTRLPLIRSKWLVSAFFFSSVLGQMFMTYALSNTIQTNPPRLPTDRKKVLKHHPDKKVSAPGKHPLAFENPPHRLACVSYSLFSLARVLKYFVGTIDSSRTIGHSSNTNDDAFFKCIQKAFEVLYTFPDRRKQFDSVDPAFDDDMPSASLFKVSTVDGVLLWECWKTRKLATHDH